MKKLNTLLVLVFAMLGAYAQPQFFNTDLGTSSNAFPLASATSNKVQWIYAPGVFDDNGTVAGGAPAYTGNITSIFVRLVATGANATYTNFAVRMGQNIGTVATWPSSTYSTGLTDVVGPGGYTLSGVVGGNWYQILLTTPFLYDPSQSLIVEIEHQNYTGTGSNIYQITTGGNQRIFGAYGATTGATGTGLADLGINLVPSGPCSAPPTPGIATASLTTPCNGQNVLLNLSGNSYGSGQTYQWESSANIGGPYTSIAPPSSITSISVIASAPLYYQCAVDCGSNIQYSTPVFLNVPSLFPGGTYTINSGLATGGSNFQTFTEAVSAISCGISSSIIFDVASGSGPYVEQISLPSTIGSTALKTVTFNCSNTTISFNSTDANKRYGVQLNGADYISFNDLTIDGTAGTYGWGFHLTNGADNNSFNFCTINTSTSNITLNNHYPIVINGSSTVALAAGTPSSNNSFTDMILSGGYNGVILYGNSVVGQEGLNNSFINTQLKEFYQYGWQMLYQKNAMISGSDISRPTRSTLTTTAGIFISTGCLNSLVENNRVHNLFDGLITSTSVCYPLYCTADGTVSEPNRFINNMVYKINNNGTLYGIYNAGGDNMRAYNNTLYLDSIAPSATAVTYGMYQTTQALGLDYRNNLIYIGRGGTGAKVGLYYNTNTSTIISNNNVVYINPATGGTNNKHYGNYGGTNFTTLVNWQAANSGAFDANSVFADPLVVNAAGDDYTPTSVATNNTGTNVGVAFDINGAPRSVIAPDCGAIEYSLPGLDAGISWVSPTSPTTAGLKTITVNLVNNLADPISSLVLTYTDGVTPVSETFSGLSFTAGTGQTFSFATQYNLSVNSSLRAYITSVNGISDNNQLNDTTGIQNLCLSLNGPYTINAGAPASTTNYQSFTTAVAALMCGGVSGPVTFDVVAGSGPYTEQVQVGVIPGSSATNTVSINGNNNVLTFASGTNYHTLRLNGTDYTSWNNLTINTTGATTGICLILSNASDNNNFTNCTFNASQTATVSTNACVAFSASTTSAVTAGNNGNNNTFTGCTTNGGYYGFSLYGNTTANITSNQILGCTIKDFYFYGLYAIYNGTTIVRNCIMERPTRAVVSSGYGIYITTSSANCLIDGNRVRNLFGGLVARTTSAAYGISNFASPTVGNENRIINNLVSDIRNNGLVYGIQNAGSNAQIYHNTIDITDLASAATGVTYGISNSIAAGVSIRNNIATINRSGTGNRYCVFYSVFPSISNNNDLYIVGGGTNYVGYNPTGPVSYATLIAYQGTGLDAGSVSVDPVYLDPLTYNYQPSTVGVNNNGAALGVSVDITGAVRNPTNPDLGCYEFDVFPYDLGMFSFVSPGASGCYTSTENIEVSIKNFGSLAIDFSVDPATVTCLVTGASTATLTASPSGTLASGATMTVTLTPPLDMTANGTYTFNVSTSMVTDGNASNNTLNTVTRTVAISAGTLSSNTPSLCVSGTPILTLAGQSGGTRQWQESTVSASGPWTNVGSGTSTYTPTAAVTQTTYYQVESSCNTNVASSNVVTVTVNNPSILSTTPGSRCGPGSVVLAATGSAGTSLNWYTSPTSTTPIGSGSPFSTPNIANTSTFYVAANEGGIGAPAQLFTSTAAGNGASGVLFDVTIINSIRIDSFSNFVPVGTNCAIFYRVGTGYGGNQSSNVGWTQIGGTVTVTSVTGSLGVIPINMNLTLTPGLYSFALLTSGTNSYTNGTALGNVWAQDANVIIREGYGGGGTPPNTIAFVNSPRNWNGRLYYSNLGCESPKTAVLATINASPSITASVADPTLCPGGTTNISVSSSNANYSYAWASAPVGYTVNGAGPHTVSPSNTTKYYVGAIDSSSGPFAGCTAVDSVTVITAPALLAGTVSSSLLNICISNTPILSVSGSAGGTIQWQESTVSASGPWTNVGTGTTTYTPAAPLTQTTYFQVEVSCQTTSLQSNVVTVTVNNPQVLSTLPGSRCGPGTVNLSATPSAGANIKWYANASGGSVLSTGNSYTTPSIASTTTYYAEPLVGLGGSDSLSIPLVNGNNSGIYHHMFLMKSTTGLTLEGIGLKCNNVVGTLTSWDVYYRPNNYQLTPGANLSAAGWILLSSVTGVPSLGATDYTYISFGLSLAIPAGATYSFYVAPVGTSTHQYASNPAGTVTASNLSDTIYAGNRGSTLFNCNTTSGQAVVKMKYSKGCVAPRVPVLATVNNPSSSTTTITAPCGSSYVWNGNSYTASGTYVVTTLNAAGCDSVQTLNLTVTPCNTTLNLTAFIQGFWDGASGMVPVLANSVEPTTAGACDSIDVYLKDASFPYSTVAYKRAVLNQNGTCTVVFAGSYTGSYYVAVEHRSAICTWSAAPVSMAGTPSYNFTTANAQSYGPNMVEVATGVWAFYSGDCVKDAAESINIDDITSVELDNSTFVFGYSATDIDGSGDVNLSDFPNLELNINAFIFCNRP